MRRLLFVQSDGPVRQALIDHVTAASAAAGGDLGSIGGVLATESEVLADASLLILDDADDGVAFCRSLRAAGATVPILLLVAEDQEAAAALEAGADEILAKPFRLGHLLTILRGILRQAEAVSDVPDFTLGPWRLSNGGRVLIDDSGDRRVRLTEKEAAILAYLQSAEGVVDRDTLLDEVWGYSAAVTTHTLETHVYRLRQKIEADPAAATLLVTEDGGYRLRAG